MSSQSIIDIVHHFYHDGSLSKPFTDAFYRVYPRFLNYNTKDYLRHFCNKFNLYIMIYDGNSIMTFGKKQRDVIPMYLKNRNFYVMGDIELSDDFVWDDNFVGSRDSIYVGDILGECPNYPTPSSTPPLTSECSFDTSALEVVVKDTRAPIATSESDSDLSSYCDFSEVVIPDEAMFIDEDDIDDIVSEALFPYTSDTNVDSTNQTPILTNLRSRFRFDGNPEQVNLLNAGKPDLLVSLTDDVDDDESTEPVIIDFSQVGRQIEYEQEFLVNGKLAICDFPFNVTTPISIPTPILASNDTSGFIPNCNVDPIDIIIPCSFEEGGELQHRTVTITNPKPVVDIIRKHFRVSNDLNAENTKFLQKCDVILNTEYPILPMPKDLRQETELVKGLPKMVQFPDMAHFVLDIGDDGKPIRTIKEHQRTLPVCFNKSYPLAYDSLDPDSQLTQPIKVPNLVAKSQFRQIMNDVDLKSIDMDIWAELKPKFIGKPINMSSIQSAMFQVEKLLKDYDLKLFTPMRLYEVKMATAVALVTWTKEEVDLIGQIGKKENIKNVYKINCMLSNGMQTKKKWYHSIPFVNYKHKNIPGRNQE